MTPSRLRCAARLGLLQVLAALCAATQTDGQDVDAASGRIVGVVYDSLSGRPLEDARVHLTPGGVEAVTDVDGRVVFAGLEAGSYRLTLRHQDIPAWVTTELRLAVAVDGATPTEVTLATPSARTLRERHCPVGDGRLAAVTVRDLLTLAPIPRAEVTVRPGDGTPEVDDTRSGRTDARGELRLCLDSPSTPLTVQARLGDARSRITSLDDTSPFVQGTLFLRGTPPSRVEGVVLEEGTGSGVDGVTVGLVGSRTRAVSDEEGRFALVGVPPGEVTLTAEHIAYGKAEGEILVPVGDTLAVEIVLSPSAIELEPLSVEVVSRTSDRRLVDEGRYDGLNRAEIERLLPRVLDFPGLLRRANIPGLRVEDVRYLDERTGTLTPGVCIEVGRRKSRYQSVCEGMVTVYVNGARVHRPEDFVPNLSPDAIESIRLLSPMEAQIQYGAGMGARNGVLLITTR